jgi:branched-chain amino acid transport system ATP-binding protein
MDSKTNLPILCIENLSITIDSRTIINNVSFNIHNGERVGIIGPNGSGKTTLFNSISGFLPASSGTITFKERDITKLQAHKRATLGIGRVFQNIGIFREMTLSENLLMALESNPSIKKNEIDTFINKYLEQVNLLHHKKSKAGSLSGGQMRLLEICRTLAFGAEFLLLDEPTAGVAPTLKTEVVNLLKFTSEKGKTVLIIEHDMGFIQNICDRVIVLDNGHIVADDQANNIRSNPKVHEIYFGKECDD